MNFVSKEVLENLRETYKPGTLVELFRMGDDPYPGELKVGCRGRVTGVDDVGTIFVDWRCHSSLGVVLGEDYVIVLDDVVTVCDGEKKEWDRREDAIAFFTGKLTEAVGAERERYSNILLALAAGEREATDVRTEE